MLPGVGNRLADDLLVPQMHSIKKAQRQTRLVWTGFKLSSLMNEAHNG
jgi:hypothetical protein